MEEHVLNQSASPDELRLRFCSLGYSFSPTPDFLRQAAGLNMVQQGCADRFYEFAGAVLRGYTDIPADNEHTAGLSVCLRLLDERDTPLFRQMQPHAMVEYAATAGRRRWFDGMAADLFDYADRFYDFRRKNNPYPDLGLQPADFGIMAADRYQSWGFADVNSAVRLMDTVLIYTPIRISLIVQHTK